MGEKTKDLSAKRNVTKTLRNEEDVKVSVAWLTCNFLLCTQLADIWYVCTMAESDQRG